MVGLVAGDLHVAGDGHDAGIILVNHHQVAVVPAGADVAAEVDLLRVLGLGQQPGVAQAHPLVGQLHLPALHDLLAEDAQLIADGIAGGRDFQRGQAVQIAGSQAAQTAVAQASVRFHIEDTGGVKAQLVDGVRQLLHQAQVVGVFHEAAAHQELQGHVVHHPPAGIGGALAGLHAPLGHNVPQHHGAGLHHVAVGGLLLGAAEGQAQLLYDLFFQLVFAVIHRILLLKAGLISPAGLRRSRDRFRRCASS